MTDIGMWALSMLTPEQHAELMQRITRQRKIEAEEHCRQHGHVIEYKADGREPACNSCGELASVLYPPKPVHTCDVCASTRLLVYPVYDDVSAADVWRIECGQGHILRPLPGWEFTLDRLKIGEELRVHPKIKSTPPRTS